MNALLIFIGAALMALSLVMSANRAGYLFFIVGPRSGFVDGGAYSGAAFWFSHAHP